MMDKQMDFYTAPGNPEFRIPNSESPREGDLYKIITAYGRTFELRYGYYGDCDRRYEPVVIYPDFLREPAYTDRGEPFVTMVQDACKSYRGEAKRTPDTTCCECKYFQLAEDWIGICTCQRNVKQFTSHIKNENTKGGKMK